MSGGQNTAPLANPLQGVPERIRALVSRLHGESLAQEAALEKEGMEGKTFDEVMKDKFIALEEDKAQYIYELCRAINAKTIVEAGTSYGVSTIYLALAVAANVAATGGNGIVVATEHEPTKANKAREYWQECGQDVTRVIDLREGDLRETLKENLENVDFLLLDSKCSRLCHVFQTTETILCSMDTNGSANTAGRAAEVAPWCGDYR